jgi:5-methylcytosine-specific restriction protein A
MPRGEGGHYEHRRDHGEWIACELCQRKVPPGLITQHHLRPKQKGGKAEHRAPLCKPCHKQVHATFGNTDLARVYDSVESLRKAPLLKPFLKWIRKQSPDRNFGTVRSKEHPHHGKRRY